MKNFFIIFLIFLVVAGCGRNRRPGVSDKELFVQQIVDPLQQTIQELDFSDMETYVVPAGIKYRESRAIDPANPPIAFNIANRNLNIKKFDLSNYYSQVRYVKLKHPKQAVDGNFNLHGITPTFFADDERLNSPLRVAFTPSIFKFTDDYIVAGDAYFGLHCYDKQGVFLYTIESNDYPKNYNASGNTFSFHSRDFKGYLGGFTAYGNICLYNLREDNKNFLCLYDLAQGKRIMTRPFEESAYIIDYQSMAQSVYHPVRAPNEDFLFTFDLKGDTLCRFPNYNSTPEVTENPLIAPLTNIYYHNNHLNVRQSLNDTVYRVISPNRLVPAYVLNFGNYKVDIKTVLNDEQSEKLHPSIWREADSYILFVYTLNRNTPNNRRDGKVMFFYSYYDKSSRQFYHFSEGIATPENQFFMENPIPDALPFILSHAEIEDNQLRVSYNKRRLDEIINNAAFPSLPPEQQNKLKTMRDELEDNEILIMILE